MSDGCTWLLNGWFGKDTWLHCCIQHDEAYFSGLVTLQTHIDLGYCVSAAGGTHIVGALMTIATIAWWYLRHYKKSQR